GQINSAYTDTKFGISQSISFPTVYSKKKALLKEEFTGSKIAVTLKEVELKKTVSHIFNTLSYLYEKKKLLLRTDSLFTGFLSKANLRFEKGETNILEKATAENQQGQIAIQLKELEQDIAIAQIQFQLALQTNEVYIPSTDNFKMQNTNNDILETAQNPRILLLQQQKQIALANTQFEQSKLSPDLIFGYNNTSIRGTGADDKYYTSSQRFHSVQIGLGIPIFNGAQKAIINSSKVKEAITESAYEIGLQTLNAEKKTALIEYQKYFQTVQWYENTALKSAATISSAATQQFSNGEINYLDWVILINQSVSIQSQYIDVIKNLNESINHINYLNSK
ncbi:MAG: TolC family protein, partial [Chitinophagaceae bacterium]